jgi:hypothetical protein
MQQKIIYIKTCFYVLTTELCSQFVINHVVYEIKGTSYSICLRFKPIFKITLQIVALSRILSRQFCDANRRLGIHETTIT